MKKKFSFWTWLFGVKKESYERLPTPQAIALYEALKERGIKAEQEKWDGFKSIDIAIPKSRFNIEVDGQHHNFNPNQALTDLKRTLCSHKKGYTTLRIPNSLVNNHLDETADCIVGMINASNRQLNGRRGRFG